MSLLAQISKGLIRTGRKFVHFGQRIHVPNCPGKITVKGEIITDLVPQGGYRQPGMTKAGRVSFSGIYKGKRVKIYSAYSTEHAKLRIKLESTDFGRRFLPRLIIADDVHMVEEWIDGLSVEKFDSSLLKRAAEEIENFLSECRNSKELIQIAKQHESAFCYFQDYLIKRIEPWCILDFVCKFKNSWQEKYDKTKNNIEIFVSHPDLSAANILRETRTGRFVVIDNELLGVGRGWILDRRNSFLKSFSEDQGEPLTQGIEQEFLQESWKLRLLGSALDAADFDRAYRIVVN
jgi:hypothetical protein